MTDYRSRLKIPINPTLHEQQNIKFFSKNGEILAEGYERIVIGDRGPYIEFHPEMLSDNMHVPEDQEWRRKSSLAYYIELRSNKDNVKIYVQTKTVDYADYKVGMCYISPFDLRLENTSTIIDKLNKKDQENISEISDYF